MQIKEKAVAYLEFVLKDEAGEVLDSSKDHGPVAYIHGMGNLVSGLEAALLGKGAGDTIDVTLQPEEAYGIYNEDIVQEVPRSVLDGVDDLEVGMELVADTPDGQQVVYVKELTDETVTIDGNHPLAGEVLNFHVDVLSVREASPEEIDHGHVHGEHGHQH